MHISIDESGSFVSAPRPGAWSVVAAYMINERSKSHAVTALGKAKAACDRGVKQEIKLKNLKEKDYFEFLFDLHRAGGALFVVATDAGVATFEELELHKREQAEKIRVNIPRMVYEEGRQAISTLADEIVSLSPQLYMQLRCQIVLINDVLSRGILYYVQRDPVTLRRFVWRIDQKNTKKSIFERAFEKIAPGILQSASFKEPMIFLEDADYSYFREFEFSEEEYPKHLQEELGHEKQTTVNIGKILRENMAFPDSKMDLSVQIADLLASGVRRCLRGEFTDNKKAADLIGKLLLQNVKPRQPINLIMFSDSEPVPDKNLVEAVRRMTRYAQSMIL